MTNPSHGSSGQPEASGRAFRGLIRHVKDQYGAEVLAEIIGGSGRLAQGAFATPIRNMAWYPYGAYSGFLSALDKRLGKGDGQLCRTVGAAAGKRDLGAIFKIYVILASAERLIRSCAKIWESYYRNAGRMEAIAWRPESTVLRIFDFPQMHPSHCQLMAGWMISTMETIGCRVNRDAQETQCMSRGGPYHEFSCSWTKR
jgi:hypothetical protein